VALSHCVCFGSALQIAYYNDAPIRDTCLRSEDIKTDRIEDVLRANFHFHFFVSQLVGVGDTH